LRITLAIARALVAAVALLVGGGVLFLHTPSGADLIRRRLQGGIAGAVAGALTAERLRFAGDRVSLYGLELRDPEGQLVARAAEVDVDLSPLGLLRRRIVLSRVAVIRPELRMRVDARGLNLTRALAARHPAAEPAAPGAARAHSRFALDLRAFELVGGVIDYHAAGSGAEPRHARLEDLRIAAHLSVGLDGSGLDAGADATARVVAPLAAPLAIHLGARGLNGVGSGRAAGLDLDLDVSVDTSGDASALQATATRAPSGDVEVEVERLRVAPRLVRALLPSLGLKTPIDATGRLSRDGAVVTAAADIDARAVGGGGGHVAVQGGFDLDARRALGVHVQASDVDLGAVFEGLPRSDLSLSLRADGGGPDLDRLDGTFSLIAPPGRLGGAAVGPVRLSVRASHGRVEADPLKVVLPGLTLTGSATATTTTTGTSLRGRSDARLSADLAIDATDLERTARSLTLLAGSGSGSDSGSLLPPLAGRGQIAVHVGGTPAAPSIAARGRFAALAVAGQSARDLTFKIGLADLRHPESAVAELHGSSLVAGGRALGEVRLALRSQRRAIAADVEIGDGKILAVSTRGRWTRARRAAVIDSFTLVSGDARWAQSGPIRLALGDGGWALGGLDLRSGDQRLRADVKARGEGLAARVDVDRLDLGRIPRRLLPARVPELGGRLDLHLALDGPTRRPEVVARVDLSHARIGRYRELKLALDGRYGGGRARATVAAAGLGASLQGQLDLPATWPVRERAAPLSADLAATSSDLGALLAVVRPGDTPAVTGGIRARLRLGGTADDPSLSLHVETSDLRAGELATGTVSLDAQAAGDAPMTLTARLGAGAGGAGGIAIGTLSLEAPLSLRTLARGQWPPRRDWLATPVTVRADLRQIALGKIAALVRRPRMIAGSAALRLDLHGTARAPEGAFNLVVSRAHGPRFPETDVRVDAAFGTRDVRVAAQIARKQRLLAWFSALAEIPAARLGDAGALEQAPLHVRLGVGPIDLHQTPLVGLEAAPGATGPQDGTATGTAAGAAKDGAVKVAVKNAADAGAGATSGPLHGRARLDVEIDGTARRPTVRATAQLRALRGEASEAGAARALLTYADAHAALDLQVTSQAGGAATVRGTSTLDLGSSSLRHGLDLARAPIDLSFDAKALDLAWLSGIAPLVHDIGGRVTAAVRVHGQAAAPAVAGRFEWVDGTLGLAGLGGYNKIHLTAHGDQRAIQLDALDARSGDGKVHLTGTLHRPTGGVAALQLVAKVNRFPIYAQGELLATASLDASARASLTHAGADGTLTIGDLHAELAKQPKNLQPLDRPADVVLVSEGHPVDRVEAKKLTRLRAARRKTGTVVAAGVAATPLPGAPPFVTRVTIDAPRNLWLRGNDADLEVGLERGFRIELGDAVTVFGQVHVERGHVDVLGRRLVVQAGSTARFAGPVAVPIIDVSAKYVDDKDNLTVLLRAQGPIDNLKVNVSAPDHPGLTETQLYTVLVVGHLASGGESGAGGAAAAVSSEALTAQAGSLVAGVLASQLQKVLSKRLPLDVLSIQTGEGLAGSRLEAGKYLSSELYIGYVGRSGANPALLQNSNAVHLEYRISSRWSFDAEYGDAGTGTADLMWTKHY
jgi:translocation and assembly module TamB